MLTENTENKMRAQRGVHEWMGVSSKTLWDWLQLLALLAITVAVILGSLRFSEQQSQIDLQIGKAVAEQQHQTDLQIAKDQEQESELNTYLDQMSTLLSDNNLSRSQPTDEVREVARDRTLAVLFRLDPVRKGVVLQFLYGAGLIMRGVVKVSLSGTDFSGAILRGANLSGADLSRTNLSGADMTGADLYGTDLSGSITNKAILPDGSTNP